MTEYIFEAREIISREEKGMAVYWDDHTRKPLSETLNSVLITEHASKLESEFIVLLDSRDNTKISAVYNLMQRDFTLLPQLANSYEQYIKKCGENEVSHLISVHKAALANGNEEATSANKKSGGSLNSLPPQRIC